MPILSDNEREDLSLLFQMKDFRSMWDIIHNEYGRFDLGDKLDDNTRINEYKYITQQLRKYMASKQDSILSHGGDLESMQREVEALINRAPEYGDERKELIYNFLRDQWLMELYHGIQVLIDERQE